MIGIWISIGIGIGTIIAVVMAFNASSRGHSVEYYTYVENNGCPPPSYFNDYIIDDLAHCYRFRY